MAQEERVLSWTVSSHTLRERSNDWFWGLGTIAVVGAIASIFFGNILLAIIIVLGAGSIGFLSTREPREHTVQIDRRGVVIDGTRYPYASVRSFWVEQDEQHSRLFISLSGILAPHFTLYLEHVEADDVRAYLKRHTQEIEQGPQLGERLLEIFGL